MELFFGNALDAHIITDYLGRVYKDFKEPFFCKVSTSADSYTMEYAIPLDLMPRDETSALITKANFYYSVIDPLNGKLVSYSWVPNPTGAFKNTESSGALLLSTPKEMAELSIAEYKRHINDLEKAGTINAADVKELMDKLSAVSSVFPTTIGNYTELCASLRNIKDFAYKIAERQRKGLIERLGDTTSNFLSSKETDDYRQIPEKWKLKLIKGKDYWYMYTMDVSKTGHYYDVGEFMNLPLFKDGMFFMPRISRVPAVNEYLPPDGMDYNFLKKYPYPFAICSSFQRAGAPLDEFTWFDRNVVEQFLRRYADKNFVGFFADEAYGGAEFPGIIKAAGWPLPKDRKEAYDALKHNYFYNYDKNSKVMPGAPFRNVANLDPVRRRYASNATGTYLHHMIASFGDCMGGRKWVKPWTTLRRTWRSRGEPPDNTTNPGAIIQSLTDSKALFLVQNVL